MHRKDGLPGMVIFFGPDGVGKTTQSRLVLKYLASRNRRVSFVWIRGGHTLAFVLSKLFVRLGYYQTVRTPSGSSYRVFDPRLLPKLSHLWALIEFVSVLPIILYKVYLRRILGYTIVADRYVVDTVVYLSYWLGPAARTVSKFLLRLVPQDAVMIHLDAETPVLKARLLDDTSPMGFVVYQRMLYRRLSASLGAATIDTTNRGIEETFKDVIATLNSD